ncbi:MAG: hypothetical protein HOC74_11140 [Gemmatimonadetes bacterium]|jgi:hypothetical protein|nr:hypothetical protein [Gemmatimonadota bacterium]
MIVSGVVIETLPGSADVVAARLRAVAQIAVEGSDGDCRLAAIWEGESGEALERFAEDLLAGDEQILGVFPVYVGEDEE